MSGTIAAIATPQAAGGIGIVRISGDDAIKIADTVFRAKSGKSLFNAKGYTAHYGRVYDKDMPIDEAIALVFRSPRSYTGEDVVELSCHGGLYMMQKILRTVLSAGANAAQPGEFTKRAFLNGKIDLTEAESVMGLISAHGEQAAQAALTALEGALSKKIREQTQILLSAAAHMSAWVDYPDEDIEELDFAVLKSEFSQVKHTLEELLAQFDAGRAITQGVETAIVGRPNVGKSTLMNLLAGHTRSIVTDIAGTTRDVVEETVRLGDLVLHLSDTAGLRDTDDPVESIGVHLAKERLSKAGLILAVFDASLPLSQEDKALLELCANRPFIAVINKTDLPKQLETQYIEQVAEECVSISAATGEGYQELRDAVAKLLGTDTVDTCSAMLATERQRDGCLKAVNCIEEAIWAIENGLTMDAINVSIDGAIEALLELTGQRANEAVVDEVFAQFCVGK